MNAIQMVAEHSLVVPFYICYPFTMLYIGQGSYGQEKSGKTVFLSMVRKSQEIL